MPKNRIFTACILAAQFLIYAHFWYGADKFTTDFPAFHAVGLLARSGAQPYSLESQCRVEREVNPGQTCLPFAHPPILLPALALASVPSYDVSYWRWAAIMTALLLLCAFPLYGLTRDPALTCQAILFFPAIFGLWMGQDNALVLLAVLSSYWLLSRQKDFLAGAALALATVKPQLVIVLAIALLFSRPRAFAGFALSSAAMVLFSIALIGVEGLQGIFGIMRVMAKAYGFGVWPEGMYNFAGILARSGLSPRLSWPLFFVVAALVSIGWKTLGINRSTFSVAIVISLFAAPHVHLWDLSLLLIPLLTLHRKALLYGSLVILATFPFGYSVSFVAVYLLMASLIAGHALQYRRSRSTKSVFVVDVSGPVRSSG